MRPWLIVLLLVARARAAPGDGRREAEQLERIAKETHDRAAYDRCGEAYLALVVANDPYGDELLYNAQVCFEEGASLDRARVVVKRLTAAYPKSRLAAKAVARIGRREGDVANFEAAATAFEAYAMRAPKEKDAPDALSDAFLYRLSLGQLDRADADLRLVERQVRGYRKDEVEHAAIRLVAAQLEAGQRAAAVARAKILTGGRENALARGAILAAVACPVALVMELCPRARDPQLVARARSELARLTDAEDPSDLGRRILLDLELDAKPADRAALAARYRELTGASDPAVTRIVAHARLAELAKRDGRIDEAATELSLCITMARDLLAGAIWQAHCERERAGLPRPPVVTPLLEHTGPPVNAPFEPAMEAEPVRTDGR